MTGPAVSMDAREATRGAPFGPEDRYRLLTDRPLPQFDSPSGVACLAVDTLRPDAPLYALVCTSALMWRRRPLGELTKIPGHGLVNPLYSGSVAAKDGGRRAVILFERPQGGSLAEIEPMREREIAHRILPPLLSAVFELAERGITHRAIRPNNIFFRLADNNEELLLGECVSAAPGAAQPVIFEPPERADALPEGRGDGAPDADLYALGMVIASLLSHRDLPTVPEILNSRRRHGSFVAAMGSTRCGSAMESLLRGVLRDDPALRWNTDNVHRWRTGIEERPTAAGTPRIAGHPFRFRGFNHDNARAVAKAFHAFPKDAMADCMDRSVETWLHHSLGDAAAAKRVREIRDRQETFPTADETDFAARVCAAIDPAGPIYFRNIVVMRDGLPALVAAAMAANDSTLLTNLTQLLRSGLLNAMARPSPSEPSALQPSFAENLARFAQETALGFGLERCLYELNPLLPCQSPQISGDGDSPAALLAEFDRRADVERTAIPSFIDRHTAAFLATQMRSYQYRLARLSRPKGGRSEDMRGEVALLGDYQSVFGPTPLHGLTTWATAVLTPLIKALHNTKARERLLDRLPSLARQGDLNALMRGLNLADWVAWDEAGYRQAVARDHALGTVLEALDNDAPARAAAAAEHGQQIANVIGFAALLIASVVTWVWLAH